MSTQKKTVYVGTYTQKLGHVDGKATGIYEYRFDQASGALEHVSTAEGQENPSFLTLHPSGKILYGVNENDEFEGKPGGSVCALAIDPATGSFKLLNQQPTYGIAPCFVHLDRTSRYAMVANYMGGNVVLYPLQDDGSLGAATDNIQHTGTGPNPTRQEMAHTHSITPDPTNTYALVCDLGLDKVMVYRLDLEKGKLLPNAEPFGTVHPGAGPRHLDFHRNGKFVYVINELDGTISVFSWEVSTGKLVEIQVVSTLPANYSGVKSCADLHMHPNGKFIYGSNRGHDSIAIFSVDQASGKLSPVGHASTQGKTPRNFVIDPGGNFLLAANQDSSTVATFRIEPQSGKLTPFGKLAEIPTPVCLKFLAF